MAHPPTTSKRLIQRLGPFLKSVWAFPAAVGLCLAIATLLGISGSSIGVYSMLDGSSDPGALAGQPRGVRSDEWLVTSQMIVAQAKENFPKVNQNIADGQNMSLLDAPEKDWSLVFKPQNLSFFVLPLQNAFAFHWWFFLVAVVLASYLFLLELFPKRILLSVLLSVLVGLSPMLFWWYANGILLAVAYSFLMALLAMRFYKATAARQRWLFVLLFTYVALCFALLLYPPFQIPCLIVVATFLVGWLASQQKPKKLVKRLTGLWPYVLVSFVCMLAIGFAFYQTNKAAIQATTHTVYPGSRVIPSGGINPLLSLTSFLAPNLQYDEKVGHGFPKNQSEGSNFIFIAPFLVLPSIYLIVRERRKNGSILWGLLLINLVLLFFLARIYIATPWLDPVYRLFLLDKVPNTRLLLGVGLAGIFQLILIIKTLCETKLKPRELWVLSLVGALSAFVCMLLVGQYLIAHYPVFIASFAKVLLFALWVSLGTFLVLQKRITTGLSVLCAFSLLAVYHVHPIYRGLGPVTTSPIISTIAAYPDDGSWVVLDDRLIINFPLLAGKDSLTSVHFYPQLKLWSELDPTRKYNKVYNRYAHVLFTTDKHITEPFTLLYADIFVVKFDACGSFLQSHARYVLSPHPLDEGCVMLKQDVQLPARHYYIYEIVPSGSTQASVAQSSYLWYNGIDAPKQKRT